jgi:hypothetical protein
MAPRAGGIHAWRHMLYFGGRVRMKNRGLSTLKIRSMALRAQACQRLNYSSSVTGLNDMRARMESAQLTTHLRSAWPHSVRWYHTCQYSIISELQAGNLASAR